MEQIKVIENAAHLGEPDDDHAAPPSAPPGTNWLVAGALLLVRVGVVVALWALVVELGHYQPIILPSPARVWQAFLATYPTLWWHVQITLLEIVLGLAAGLSVALVLGYLLAHSRWAERLLAPYLVASQALPAVAIAPLLYIWFGNGLFTKVLVCALVVFFPVLINVVVGVRAVEPDLRDLLRSLRATRWQVLTTLEIPAALPVLLGGLKVGATLAVIGAIVGEANGGRNQGLWYYTFTGMNSYDTPQVFVGILTMMTLALTLYGAVAALERHLLRWKHA